MEIDTSSIDVETVIEIIQTPGTLAGSIYIINKELEIHCKALKGILNTCEMDLHELFRSTKDLELAEGDEKIANRDCTRSLKSLKRKYCLSLKTESLQAKNVILQTIGLPLQLFDNIELHENSKIIAIVDDYIKQPSFFQAAGQFAKSKNPATVSEFLAYMEIAMLSFGDKQMEINQYKKKFSERTGRQSLTRKQKQRISNDVRNEVGIPPGVDIDEYYWDQLHASLLSDEGLLTSDMNQKVFDLIKLVPDSGFSWIGSELSAGGCVDKIKTLAKMSCILFGSHLEALCHILKHDEFRDGVKYLSDANSFVYKADCVSSNISQDGNARRFVFEDGEPGIRSRAVVLEIDGQVFLATYHRIS